MKATLQRIKPLNPEFIPPTGAVAFGVTPDGKQLYREVLKRSRAVPRIDPKTGEQMWRKNQMTGEPLYPVNQPEIYTQERVFYLESEGNGNVRRVFWAPPSQEELERAQKAQRVASMNERLAEALVDADVEPEALLAALKLRTPAAAPTVSEPEAPVSAADLPLEKGEFPKHLGYGRWKLSDGTEIQGKKAMAVAAEENLSAGPQTKRDAAATPEE